ncbi:MAG: DUF1648 domain-containing protein [Candidatus Zixiibacteriota bacterium]|nr:MAG: DUF1648 domain-containing protein [candidate division Zixibacteria bacterium]
MFLSNMISPCLMCPIVFIRLIPFLDRATHALLVFFVATLQRFWEEQVPLFVIGLPPDRKKSNRSAHESFRYYIQRRDRQKILEMPFLNMFEKIIKSARKKQPKLEIPRTRLEIYCEVVAAVAVALVFIYLSTTWTGLPDKVPTHFNFAGTPDDWGSKYSLLLLSGITFVLYAGLSILSRFPHIYNYPFAITDVNRQRQYLLARQMITALKAELVCVFVFMTWQTIGVAQGKAENLTGWFMPVFLVVVLGTVIIYFVKAYRAR